MSLSQFDIYLFIALTFEANLTCRSTCSQPEVRYSLKSGTAISSPCAVLRPLASRYLRMNSILDSRVLFSSVCLYLHAAGDVDRLPRVVKEGWWFKYSKPSGHLQHSGWPSDSMYMACAALNRRGRLYVSFSSPLMGEQWRSRQQKFLVTLLFSHAPEHCLWCCCCVGGQGRTWSRWISARKHSELDRRWPASHPSRSEQLMLAVLPLSSRRTWWNSQRSRTTCLSSDSWCRWPLPT